MINKINFNPENWKKPLYIAKKIRIDYDDEGNEIPIYDDPQPYNFNYQPTLSDSEVAEFGEKAKLIQRAVIPISFINEFKEFDVAYLDGVMPNDENVNGRNANYRLLPPRNGNSVIIIYFEKLAGK